MGQEICTTGKWPKSRKSQLLDIQGLCMPDRSGARRTCIDRTVEKHARCGGMKIMLFVGG